MSHVRHTLFLFILLAGMAQAVLAGPRLQESVCDAGHGSIATVIHRMHMQDVEPSEYESDIDPDVERLNSCLSERSAKAPESGSSDIESSDPNSERPIFLVVQSFLI